MPDRRAASSLEPDGEGVAAELGLVQDQRGDDKEADQPAARPQGNRSTPKMSARMKTCLNQPPTGSVAVGQVWDWALVMNGAEALGHHHGAEGGDEGGQLQPGHQDAVEQAEGGAHAHGHKDRGQNQGPLDAA